MFELQNRIVFSHSHWNRPYRKFADIGCDGAKRSCVQITNYHINDPYSFKNCPCSQYVKRAVHHFIARMPACPKGAGTGWPPGSHEEAPGVRQSGWGRLLQGAGSRGRRQSPPVPVVPKKSFKQMVRKASSAVLMTTYQPQTVTSNRYCAIDQKCIPELR